MNIKINRDALLKPLANVASIVERKHALPILSNILIQGKDGQVQLTATDLEMQVSLSFKADLKEEIATTISARKFFDITRSLPDDCVIDIAIKDNRVSVKANKSRFAIQTLPAKDTANLLAGKLVLESGDRLVLSGSNNVNLKFIASILETLN